MIVNRLLKGFNRKGKEEDDDLGRSGCAILLIGIVVVIAVVMRLVFWFLPDKTAPLLAEADGLLRYGSVAEAAPHTELPLTLPEDRLGSEIKVVGVYTKPTKILPEGSTVIVLVKDDWRFADITTQPIDVWEALQNRYSAIGTPVVIGQGTGYLVHLPAVSSRCLPPTKNAVGACELKTLVLFSSGNLVLTVAGDGTHITDGELLLLARDIASQLPESKTPPTP